MLKPDIILFDGICNLCNSSINFVIDRDPARRYRFAALQSATGKKLMKEYGIHPEELTSIVLIEGGKAYQRSTAALRISRRLASPWPLLYGFILLPAVIRDAAYDLVAKNRYRWFGKQDKCRIPTPDLRSLFLEE